MNIVPVLAEVSARGASDGIWGIFFFVLAGLVLWGVGRFVFPKFDMPPKGMMYWDCLFVIIAAVMLVNFFLGLAGKPLFRW